MGLKDFLRKTVHTDPAGPVRENLVMFFTGKTLETGNGPIQTFSPLDVIRYVKGVTLETATIRGKGTYVIEVAQEFSRENFKNMGLEEGKDYTISADQNKLGIKRFRINQQALENALGIDPASPGISA